MMWLKITMLAIHEILGQFWLADLNKVEDDSVVRGADYRPNFHQNFTQSGESRQLSVISGVGITRCGHIERKDKDTAR